MGKISMMSTLVALTPAILKKKAKQHQKEVPNDDQLKPNLTTFSAYLCGCNQ